MVDGTIEGGAPVVAQLVITMRGDGSVGVEGCIDNKLISFGLLEIAKQSVVEFAKQKENRIQAPPPGSAAFLSNSNPFGKK